MRPYDGFLSLRFLPFAAVLLLTPGCSSLSKHFDYSVKEDFVFTPAGERRMFFDIYRPEGVARAPIVLVIHGGGWRSRNGDMESVCKQLAQQGFLALNLTYRLAPKNVYPAAIDDVRAALKYVRAHAAELGGDANSISTWGYSAGGHLALLLGLDPAAGLKAIVAGGAPTDLTVYPKASMVLGFMGIDLEKNPKLWAEASPINEVSDKSPPTFLYHGRQDWLVDIEQMRMMKKKLEEHHVEVRAKELSYLGHLSTYFFSQSAVDEGIEFLRAHR